MNDDSLSISPVCPEGVELFKLRSISYMGNSFNVEFLCAPSAGSFATLPYEVAITPADADSNENAPKLSVTQVSKQSVTRLSRGETFRARLSAASLEQFVIKAEA